VLGTLGPQQSFRCCVADALLDLMGSNLVVNSKGMFEFSRRRVCDEIAIDFQ